MLFMNQARKYHTADPDNAGGGAPANVSREHYVKEYEAEKAKGAAADGEYMSWLYQQASAARPAESSAIFNQYKASKAPAPAGEQASKLPNMDAYLKKCIDRVQKRKAG